MKKFGFALFGCLSMYCWPCFAGLIYACQDDYYVSKCSDVSVGTNWLKGLNEETMNLYDYSAENKNVENLRNFFAGTEISYTNTDGELQVATEDEVKESRDIILSRLCTPDTVTCAKCPDDGKLSHKVAYDSNTQKWKYFYSIADCYRKDFSDSTGTFVYKNELTDTPMSCYYNVETRGTYIYNMQISANNAATPEEDTATLD